MGNLGEARPRQMLDHEECPYIIICTQLVLHNGYGSIP